jgi:hypothetical protein
LGIDVCVDETNPIGDAKFIRQRSETVAIDLAFARDDVRVRRT